MTKFICSNCKGLISSESIAGTKEKCGHCQEVVTVVEILEEGFVLQDFVITKKINMTTFEAHQVSLDIDVKLTVLISKDKESIKTFVKQGREKAKDLSVHSMGQEESIFFQASILQRSQQS